MIQLKANSVKSFVTQYVLGELGRQKIHRTYGDNVYEVLDDGRLVYKSKKNEYVDVSRKHDDGMSYTSSEIQPVDTVDTIALRTNDGKLLGNASRIEQVEQHLRRAMTTAQQTLQDMKVPMVPFGVFAEADLNIFETIVVDQGLSEKIKVFRFVDGVQLRPRLFKESDFKNKYNSINKRNTEYLPWKLPAMWVRKNELENDRHYIGAMLIDIEGHRYLIDIDRKELEFYRMNPFIVEVEATVSSIEEAYLTLKPDEVVQAEKDGLEVMRQGEWFFIEAPEIHDESYIENVPKKYRDIIKRPDGDKYGLLGWSDSNSYGDVGLVDTYRLKKVDPEFRPTVSKMVKQFNALVKRYNKNRDIIEEKFERNEKTIMRGTLKAGDNRPNNVDKLFTLRKQTYVKGKVRHSGREHEDMILKKWYKPIPNTAIKSFTLQGEID